MLAAASAAQAASTLPNGSANGNHSGGYHQQQAQQQQQPQHAQQAQQSQQAQQAQHAQQQHMRVKLHCMMSQCQLLDRQSSAEQALATAKAAVQAASGYKDPGLIAAALQQLSR